MDKTPANFTIEEVTRPDDPHIAGTLDVFSEAFPHLSPGLDSMLASRLDPAGRVRTQLFVGLCNDAPAGLLQLFYEVWRDGLIAIADLVGVAQAHRGTGLGLGLMHRALSAPRDVAAGWGLPAQGLLASTEPAQGDPQSWRVRRVKMYEKMGGQVRRDLVFRFDGQPEPDGEILIWFPMRPEVANVSTKALASVLWKSGGLPEAEFVRRYGKPEDAEAAVTLRPAPWPNRQFP